MHLHPLKDTHKSEKYQPVKDITQEATVLIVSQFIFTKTSIGLFINAYFSLIVTGSNLYKTQGEGASPNHFGSSGFISSKYRLLIKRSYIYLKIKMQLLIVN